MLTCSCEQLTLCATHHAQSAAWLIWLLRSKMAVLKSRHKCHLTQGLNNMPQNILNNAQTMMISQWLRSEHVRFILWTALLQCWKIWGMCTQVTQVIEIHQAPSKDQPSDHPPHVCCTDFLPGARLTIKHNCSNPKKIGDVILSG